MRTWLKYLTGFCRLPVRGGFAELDTQIEKLRILRDSYREQSQEQRHMQMVAAKKGGEQLCIP